jgi:hypothetical protein
MNIDHLNYDKLPEKTKEILDYLIAVRVFPAPKDTQFVGVGLRGLTPAAEHRIAAIKRHFRLEDRFPIERHRPRRHR